MIDEKRIGQIIADLPITSKIRLGIAYPIMLVFPRLGRWIMPNVLIEEVVDDE